MVVIAALRRVLLLFAVLGLLFAPAAIGMAMAAMNPDAGAQMEMDGDADMPCCPDEQPIKKFDCGKPCPLALICSTSLVVNFGSNADWKVLVTMRNLTFSLPSDNDLLSTFAEPPTRPPRA
ncbi:hypothetical protein Q9314_27800 (plasmid) [Shinella sumterensis]|nr:hypothetical protein Q9314_27800 [Shinella sumterensis]